MKCQKMKKYFYVGLSAFMALYLSLCSCIGSYASTESGVLDYAGTYVVNTYDLLERFWDVAVRELSKTWVIFSNSLGIEFSEFVEWLQSGDSTYDRDLLTQYPNTVIHSTHPPGSDPLNYVSQSDQIDIPVPVQDAIL